MLKEKYTPGFIVAFVLSAVFFCITFFTFITHPGHLLLQMDGDAVKNYFTFLYQVTNGKGAWFNGMNYPYGENIVFTDGQPFLSIPLSYLNSIFHFSPSTGLVILHLFLVFCYILAIVYVYKILIHFNVVPFMAVIFSTLIIILSPQLLKTNGHFALSYSCVIPMMWYWFIQYLQSNKIKYTVFIALLGILAVFSHPYFLAMFMFWLAFYSLGYLVFTKGDLKSKVKHLFPLILSFISVFAAFKIFLILTDPVKDRPTYPWGFLDACTTFSQIFTSVYSPIWQAFKDKPFYRDINQGGEGNAYLGIVVVITTFLGLLTALKNFIFRKEDAVIGKSRFSFLWVFVAFGTLAVAFGFPFVLNMDLLMYASVLKQFRSLGRFSWLFYYVMAVYTVLVIYQCYSWLITKDKKMPAYMLVGIAISVWAFECLGYSGYIRKKAAEGLDNYDTFFSQKEKGWVNFLSKKGYKPQDFQGMLLLPYFHVGTEKLWIADNNVDWQLTFGLKAAIQLKLPLVDVMMSRSSWGQAMKQVRLVGGPFANKPILGEGNGKPYLLLYPPQKANLDPDSKYLLDASDFIGDGFNFKVYVWYPERTAKADSVNLENAADIYQSMLPGDTCLNCNGYYFVEHFKTTNTNDTLFGPGALKAKMGFDSTFLTRELPQKLTDSTDYEFSAWVLLNSIDYSSPNFEIVLMDDGGVDLKRLTIKSTSSLDNYKMWFRVSCYFKVPPGFKKLSCKIYDWGYYSLDEVLFRPANALVISKSRSGSVMVNNHFVKH